MTSPSENNSYFLDPESGAEMARLITQDRITTQEMGGPLAEQVVEQMVVQAIEQEQPYTVLDIGCGPGGWALTTGHLYPTFDITGIDISGRMIRYANGLASTQSLKNVHFEQINALEPFPFPDNTFNLVNGRLLVGFMSCSSWPPLLKECQRITRPGGIIRLCECDGRMIGFSSSAAAERVNKMGIHALYKAGRCFAPCDDGSTTGVVPVLPRLLHDAGYQNIQHRVYGIDWSAGTDIHDAFSQEILMGLQGFEAFLLKWNVTTHEEFTSLYWQLKEDVKSPNFSVFWYLTLLWGINAKEAE